MNKKRVEWITADYFLDCDLSSGLVESLLDKYDIDWTVIAGREARFSQSDIDALSCKYPGLKVHYKPLKHRLRDPRLAWELLKISREIKGRKGDATYLNYVVASPWELPLFLGVRSPKTIFAVHQGEVHAGMSHKRLSNWLRDIVYKPAKQVCMFSKSQAKAFAKHYPKVKIYVTSLLNKDFGAPKAKPADDGITRFLSFGLINYAKNIDLLIEAAEIAYQRGYRNFKVSINGKSDNWEPYAAKIKHPELFDLDIRMIDNAEIPDLFGASDYFVQPYRVVSQSGPTKIAFNYNVPIIASNIGSFCDEVVEGVTGFRFEQGNADALADVMCKVMDMSAEERKSMRKRMQEYVDTNFSNSAIVGKYVGMIDEVIG